MKRWAEQRLQDLIEEPDIIFNDGEKKMGIDEQYEKWQFDEAYKSLSNWSDVIIQQLEDVGSVSLGDLDSFKKALLDCDKLFYGAEKEKKK